MSSNITHMPLGKEYLRVFVSVDEEERFAALSLFATRFFRVAAPEMVNALRTVTKEAEKRFDPAMPEYTNMLANLRLNNMLSELEQQGKIYTAVEHQGVINEPYAELFGVNYVNSHDDYIIFNPGVVLSTVNPRVKH